MKLLAGWTSIPRVLWELVRFDLSMAIGGFQGVYGIMRRTPVRQTPPKKEAHGEIVHAMKWARSLYWKRIPCLQESIVTARLLRGCGFDAQVVFGYRLEPVTGHAWVEVNGQPLGDGRMYRRAMNLFSGIPNESGCRTIR